MNRKWIIPIVIVLIVLFALIFIYMGDNPLDNSTDGKESFNVSSTSYDSSRALNKIKTSADFKGYNEESVKWMESLGNKKVFFGNDTIVIMSGFDALKLSKPIEVTDSYIFTHLLQK